jgi:hypothetical protein
MDVENTVVAQSLWDYMVCVLAGRISQGKAAANSHALAKKFVGEMQVEHSRSAEKEHAITKNMRSKLAQSHIESMKHFKDRELQNLILIGL